MERKLFILLSMILLVVGLVLIMHSSYFEVKTIEVVGNHHMSSTELIEASGVSKGENIFLLPGREVANRLMNYVRIKGVKLDRGFPDKLIIRVNERLGLGLFPLEDGRRVEVSSDGMVLEIYGPGEVRPRIPLIEGIYPKIQDKHIIMNEYISEFIYLIKELYPIQKEITKVSYSLEDIRVVFQTGTVVYFGHIADVRKNITIFQSIWYDRQNPAKELAYIDLRYTGKPVIRQK